MDNKIYLQHKAKESRESFFYRNNIFKDEHIDFLFLKENIVEFNHNLYIVKGDYIVIKDCLLIENRLKINILNEYNCFYNDYLNKFKNIINLIRYIKNLEDKSEDKLLNHYVTPLLKFEVNNDIISLHYIVGVKLSFRLKDGVIDEVISYELQQFNIEEYESYIKDYIISKKYRVTKNMKNILKIFNFIKEDELKNILNETENKSIETDIENKNIDTENKNIDTENKNIDTENKNIDTENKNIDTKKLNWDDEESSVKESSVELTNNEISCEEINENNNNKKLIESNKEENKFFDVSITDKVMKELIYDSINKIKNLDEYNINELNSNLDIIIKEILKGSELLNVNR